MKYALSIIIFVILKFWNFFNKVEYILSPGFQKLLNEHKQFILTGWHNNITTFVPILSYLIIKKHKYVTSALVSKSKDGEIIQNVFDLFNISTVRGSSSKGGAAAFKELLRKINQGVIPTISPDGPRGPRYIAKKGVIQIAAHSGLPIIPLCTIPSKYYEFEKSWDQQRFPKFGSTIYIEFSEPFYVPKLKSEEEILQYCHILENKMMELEEKLKKMNLSTGKLNDN